MSKRSGNRREASEDVERLIAVIAIGLKPHARATLAEAFKRGYAVESEIAGLVPDEKARNPQALAKDVEDIRKCLRRIRVSIVQMLPVRTGKNGSEAEKLLSAVAKKESTAEWRQHYRANPYGIASREISKYKLLSNEEVKELCDRRIGQDGWEARNTLVEHNLRLAMKYAWRILRTEPARRSGLELMDLFQEGVVGLMKAAEFFKPELGFKFSTFAWWWVRQRIQRAIEDEPSPIRIPVTRRTQWYKIRREISTFRNRFGYEPSVEELGAVFNLRPEAVQKELLRMHAAPGFDKEVRRLDAPIGESGDDDMHELTPDRMNLNPEQLAIARDELEAARKRLRLMAKLASLVNSRNGEIFAMRYGLNDGLETQVLEDVGEKFNLTRERIRQILNNEVWPSITRLGLKKNEGWFLGELERIKLLERLTGIRANL